MQKDSLLFEVLGDLDELNCAIGLAKLVGEKEKPVLERIQRNIFRISSLISGFRKDQNDFSWLEKEIKRLEKSVKIGKNFVIPGKNKTDAWLHLVRAFTRRVERKLISLSKKQKVAKEILNYFNRLSWFLFLMAEKTAG